MDKYINANIIFSKFSKNYMDLKKELPIRPSEMAVLNIITQLDGRYMPFMIARLLGVSKPMITAHIGVLLKKGYIRKEISSEDKRSFFVLPTEKAIELTDKYKIKQADYIKEIEKTLGEGEFEQLLTLMDKALPAFEKIKED